MAQRVGVYLLPKKWFPGMKHILEQVKRQFNCGKHQAAFIISLGVCNVCLPMRLPEVERGYDFFFVFSV